MSFAFGVLFFLTVNGILSVAAESQDKSSDEIEFLKNEIKSLKLSVGQYNSKLQNLISELKQAKSALLDLEIEDKKFAENFRSKKQINKEVAFHCQLTKDLTGLANHQTVIFDQVKINIGNGYNSSNGIFIAPTSGTYVFSWVTTNRDRSYMNTELMLNGQMFGKVMSDAMDHNDYAAATNIGVMTLTAGDRVWIRVGTWHSGAVAGDLYSTFSGWLLNSGIY